MEEVGQPAPVPHGVAAAGPLFGPVGGERYPRCGVGLAARLARTCGAIPPAHAPPSCVVTGLARPLTCEAPPPLISHARVGPPTPPGGPTPVRWARCPRR